jgi:hypothetical protein
MITRDERNRFDFVRIETAEIAIPDQVVRVFVVALVADVDADVVQQGGVLEPFALAVGEAVHHARLLEEAD